MADEENKILQEKTNKANNILFDEITYQKEGTYRYKIYEVQGHDATISYDDSITNVTVEVKNNDGQLEATATYEGNAVFTNTYTPKAGSVVLEAEKVLTGRSLVAGEFTFELVDQEGQVIQSQTNDGTGKFTSMRFRTTKPVSTTIRSGKKPDKTVQSLMMTQRFQ
ncbi:hypothetical protein ODV97_07265 [Enterococcus gallinarum]|nr:hypothetical protein [Enterococcus gallinarum]